MCSCVCYMYYRHACVLMNLRPLTLSFPCTPLSETFWHSMRPRHIPLIWGSPAPTYKKISLSLWTGSAATGQQHGYQQCDLPRSTLGNASLFPKHA